MSSIAYYRKRVQYWVGIALRDYPQLRHIKNRTKLIEKVWEISNTRFNPETITRSARLLQNTKGLYLPEEWDDRDELEEDARQYYRGDKECYGGINV